MGKARLVEDWAIPAEAGGWGIEPATLTLSILEFLSKNYKFFRRDGAQYKVFELQLKRFMSLN